MSLKGVSTRVKHEITVKGIPAEVDHKVIILSYVLYWYEHVATAQLAYYKLTDTMKEWHITNWLTFVLLLAACNYLIDLGC